MTKFTRLYQTVLIASAAAWLPSPAHANDSVWSVTGAGCVPTGQTASGIGTFNSAGDVSFPAGKIGEIILTCPVPSSVPSAGQLMMTYRDTDGQATSLGVKAALRQKSLTSAGVATVGQTLDSNAFAPVTGYSRVGLALGNCAPGSSTQFKFDHTKFTYYIQVNMTRRTSQGQLLLASVDLTRTGVIC